MKQLLALLLLSLPFQRSLASNGHVIGNGGSALRCETDGQAKYIAYDLVEGEILWGLTPMFSPKSDYLDKATDLVRRLVQHNPSRAELYTQWIAEFPKKLRLLPSGVHLVDLPDVLIGVIPQNCKIIQTIVQTNLFDDSVSYVTDSDIWNSLDNDSKAALVLHEVIYKEALQPENRHENSVKVRHFNQILHADLFKEMSLRGFINFLHEHEFSKAEAHGVPIQLFYYDLRTNQKTESSLKFYDNNSIESASLLSTAKFQANNININYTCSSNLTRRQDDQYLINFYSNHGVKSVDLPVLDTVDWGSENSCGGGILDLKDFGLNGKMRFNYLQFSEDGQLALASINGLLNGPILAINESNLSFEFSIRWSSTQPIITFTPNEKIEFSAETCIATLGSGNFFLFDWKIPKNGRPLQEILLPKQGPVTGPIAVSYCR